MAVTFEVASHRLGSEDMQAEVSVRSGRCESRHWSCASPPILTVTLTELTC